MSQHEYNDDTISKPIAIASPSENMTSLKSTLPEVPSEHDIEKRKALRDQSKRWPNATVPYELHGDFSETQRQSIRTAMEHFHNHTCIRFVEHSDEVDYLKITLGDENWSEVGRRGGDQLMSLSPYGCLELRVVLHELMHTLGFLHEHSRPDRRSYVTIKWRNILTDRKPEFKKWNESFVDLLNTTYNYSSIMHYGAFAFSTNTARKTIATNVESPELGRHNKLSDKDVLRLRMYYNCVWLRFDKTQSSRVPYCEYQTFATIVAARHHA
ncbi:zinc metalloproteinase nas-4-like [Asterias rubens]|uniref:zinc metalloproteinase nas-4-like n=1 Tax=Asterias rubens TaxID=7604 RepID=UPI001455429D|nr:zinc metalloproteinase nas-4-like [Asterias rubens]